MSILITKSDCEKHRMVRLRNNEIGTLAVWFTDSPNPVHGISNGYTWDWKMDGHIFGNSDDECDIVAFVDEPEKVIDLGNGITRTEHADGEVTTTFPPEITIDLTSREDNPLWVYQDFMDTRPSRSDGTLYDHYVGQLLANPSMIDGVSDAQIVGVFDAAKKLLRERKRLFSQKGGVKP